MEENRHTKRVGITLDNAFEIGEHREGMQDIYT
jgi:hypothetical protein